jgi:HK97 family phage major capsid protein
MKFADAVMQREAQPVAYAEAGEQPSDIASLDRFLARQGIPRSKRRELYREIKGRAPAAEPEPTPSAAEKPPAFCGPSKLTPERTFKMKKLHLLGGIAATGLIAVRAEADPTEALARAFETFKAEHTQHLADVKAGLDDVVRAEKIDRINDSIGELQAAVDEQAKKIAAAQLQPGDRKVADPEYTAAWNSFVRDGNITERVQASVDKSSSAAGGYLAPTEWDRTITDKLVKVSPMRSICQVQAISVAAFSKLFNLRGMSSGWVGDQAARPATNTPTFGSLSYTPGELYANPAASQGMLDDAQIDLEQLIGDDIATEFARAEGAAFISGDGTNKPFGILTYVTGAANAAAHPFGAVLVRTATGTVNKLDKADDVVSFVHDLPSEKTDGARFVMNRNTLAAVRLCRTRRSSTCGSRPTRPVSRRRCSATRSPRRPTCRTSRPARCRSCSATSSGRT